ncbi:putative polysaccharide biosynthesis protein [Candidatus Contubernalis alkaliaceticus]|uniref:putative polysaccharide biosynthesis protein n=1 Tax=Candidatus Contubernalis alkaliaceticus TaxID=338645 RepID=UPI001F4BDC56|nr:polysaccharide biosynthesis protein [Candidatus Contubernalis alkalaceticus]UNC90706.1 polysaccharide biosynthesis protein [Candidatus Contubernalis alkalaceticus]
MLPGKQSFIKGAVILTLAGIISRMIGAIFRIVLAALIGDEGIGLYQMAYPIYSALLIISTAGIPIAVSKLVAENLAVKNYYGAVRVFKVAVIVLAVSGFIISVGLFYGADYIVEYVIGDSQALIPILFISPAIFFVAVMSAFRGFFQGQQSMLPTGISQIIEQITRVAVAIYLALALLPRGLEYSAGGATFGAAAGAVFGLAFLVIYFFKTTPDMFQKAGRQRTKESLGFSRALYKIAAISIPITVGNLVLPLISILDLSIVPQQLQTAGFTVERARALYGQLTGMAGSLIQIPAILTIALAISLVPSISEALALNNQSVIRRNTNLVVRLTIILGLPAAVGLFILAEPITVLLFDNAEAALPLKASALSVVFITLYQTTTGILHGMGKTMLPVKHMVYGAFIKTILTWTLTAQPQFNIQGAAFATVIGFAVSSLLNFLDVYKLTRVRLTLSELVIKPLSAVTGMGVVVYLAYIYLNQLFTALFLQLPDLVTASRAISLSNAGAALLAIVAGMVSYGIFLFITGSITREDLKLIPKLGPYLIRLANMLHILRG